ncbi:MAG: murein biosynthesis integral membrane protein MurJ [Sciscionella sp.]|nr:murein biosynthesis integral membrane protein MurJ [Sciscionella sp.]
MAIATLVSRVTGFVSKLVLAWLLGFGIVNDAYNVANTLPNIILEFLLGGVLTSVAVPVLVRAQHDDPDGGEAYTQRLLSMSIAMLAAATVIAVACTPLLIRIYVTGGSGATRELATAFGYLLLPEIVFYGISALIGAVLNARNVFAPTAWAPVLNNVVVIFTALVYVLTPGQISTNPVRMGEPKLIVLGVGTTLGIVAQAVVLIPALRKTGFRWRWRWGWDSRLSEFGGLALWTIGYVGVSQIGVVVINRVATSAAPGGVAIYNYAWLLVQFPYGVIGFSLLTAILPRMSRAAADGDHTAVVDDLSLGSRLSSVLLGPISGLMTILGPEIGMALFSLGRGGADATRLGLALTTSAFGLLPYTITLLQLRVFYAMKDSRTPTLIMLIMVAIKIPLFYLCPVVLGPEQVVYGLTFVNAFGFVVGAVVGQFWLYRRLGRLDTMRTALTIGKAVMASAWGAAAALVLIKMMHAIFGGASRAALSWPTLILGALLGAAVAFGVMVLLRVGELRPAVDRVLRLVRR